MDNGRIGQDELLAALLRCLREIQPHHIPGDVYVQAQRAVARAESARLLPPKNLQQTLVAGEHHIVAIARPGSA